MRIRFVSSVVLALFSTGCVASVHPFYTPADVVVDPALVGIWGDSTGKETAAILRPASGNVYTVAYTDDKGVLSHFVGHLARVRGRLLLDLAPDPDFIPASSDVKDLLYPLHTFVYIDAVGPRIHMTALNPDSLDAMVKRNPASVPHIPRGSDGWAFSAPSAELTAFIDTYARRPGALGEPATWVRRSR